MTSAITRFLPELAKSFPVLVIADVASDTAVARSAEAIRQAVPDLDGSHAERCRGIGLKDLADAMHAEMAETRPSFGSDYEHTTAEESKPSLPRGDGRRAAIERQRSRRRPVNVKKTDRRVQL
jgi:hypothetical protein